MQTTQIVEALLFASDAPLTAGDIARADESLDEDAVEAAIQQLRSGYEESGRAFQIYEVAGGYQILTLPDYSPYLERFATIPQSPKLSQAALEALAVIAYRQPIDRVEIEEIRGVASSGVLRTLQDRGLIDVVGRGEGLGRPMLYGTTQKFLEHFGFRSLEDLPRSEELPVVLTGVEPPPMRRADDPVGLKPADEDDVAEAQAEDEAAALAGRTPIEVGEEPSPEDIAEAIVAASADDEDEFADFDIDAPRAIDENEDADDDLSSRPAPTALFADDDDDDFDDLDDDDDPDDDDDADGIELDEELEFGTDDDMDVMPEDDLAQLADEDEDTSNSTFTSAS